VTSAADARGKRFHVQLDNFAGPFDLLLQLISRHELDVTEVALAVVTDDFIRHLRELGTEQDLDQTSEFLLIAATLLDLKAARLLPRGEVEDEDDLAVLEARDLLFARLLQYRAYKLMTATFAEAMAIAPRRYPRSVGLEERFASLLPEVLLAVTPADLAALAGRALTPRAPARVGLEHLHAPTASVREQGAVLVERLRTAGTTTFAELTADSPDLVTTVARFLALLQLFRAGSVGFVQDTPLGPLTVTWSGADEGGVELSDEFDRPPDAPTPVDLGRGGQDGSAGTGRMGPDPTVGSMPADGPDRAEVAP